jgi:hypothetical protein
VSIRLTCQACCPSCGLHFAGDDAFARHLSDDGHRDPREVRRRDGSPGLVVKTEAGECRMVVADRDGRKLPPLRPIVIWQTPPSGWAGPADNSARSGFAAAGVGEAA